MSCLIQESLPQIAIFASIALLILTDKYDG